MSTYNMTAPSEGYVPSIFQPRKNVIESRSGGCCGVQRSLRRFFRRRGFGAYLYWFKVAVALAGTTVLWLGAWNLSQCVAACHACTQHSVAAVWCWGLPTTARAHVQSRTRARARTTRTCLLTHIFACAHARAHPDVLHRYDCWLTPEAPRCLWNVTAPANGTTPANATHHNVSFAPGAQLPSDSSIFDAKLPPWLGGINEPAFRGEVSGQRSCCSCHLLPWPLNAYNKLLPSPLF